MKFYTSKFKLTPIAFIFSFFVFLSEANAQQSLQDSMVMQAKNNVVILFFDAIKENIGLYNGSEYLHSPYNIKSSCFFKSADILNGSVYYDGNFYENIPMHFDMATNDVVIPDYTKSYLVKLIASKIDYFIIDGSRFINGSIIHGVPLPQLTGFYQVLYNNKTSVFARKEKKLELSAKLDENDSHYIEFDWYYVYINKELYQVRNERSVLNVFKERKAELKRFINSNKINFKKNFEDALIRTAAYYDQIEN